VIAPLEADRVIVDTHALPWLDRNDAALCPLTRSKVNLA
jgi:hypothetical protein